MDPLTLTLVAKSAPVVLPVLSVAFKAFGVGDDKLLGALADLGLNIAAGSSSTAIEKVLRAQPGVTAHITNEHLMRYTGTVIGALISRYRDEGAPKAQRADLKKLAAAAPEGWLDFVRAGCDGLEQVRDDEFLQRLAAALHDHAADPALAHVPIATFITWLSGRKNLSFHASGAAVGGLRAWLREHLSHALLAAIVSEHPDAAAAYKDTLLRGLLDLRAEVGRIGRNQDAMAAQQMRDSAAILRIENSPGFDLDKYAEALLKFVSPLPLAEIVNQPDLPVVRVSDVFVPLNVRELADLDARRFSHAKEIADWDGREQHHDAPEELRQKKEQMAEFLRSSPPRDALDLRRQLLLGSHIVLGEAGGGKTLLSRHIAALWAAQRLDPAQPDTLGGIPI